MGLVSLASIRGEVATVGTVEYGSDGGPTQGFNFTPWPGVVNDSLSYGPVTQEVAEGLPGVGRGVELICGVMSQLRPQLFENEFNPDIPTRRLPTPPLLQNPDPTWHGLPAWMSALVSSMAWHGDGFAYRGAEVSDYRGYPLRLPLLAAEKVSWQDDAYRVSGNGGQEEVAPADMLHAAVGVRSGYRMGRGILDKYQTTLKLMLATEHAQYVLMKDGKPMGILSLGVDVTPEEAADYKTGFLNAVRESSVAAIGNADFKPVQWNASDLAMIPTREFNLRLASDLTGVPPYLLGVPSESRVYANMETEWANFIRVTLGRYVAPIETVLSDCFPRSQTVQINTDQLLRADAAARWSVYATGVGIGALTVNEVRALENMEPLPEPEPEPEPTDQQQEEQ